MVMEGKGLLRWVRREVVGVFERFDARVDDGMHVCMRVWDI